MYHPFQQMPENARIWIFQSTEYLQYEAVERISARLMNFLNEWKAHGKELEASFTIQHGHFILVALDEASYQATGCSIDKLVHQVQALEKELNQSFLDRTQIAYRDENGMVQTMHMVNFRAALESGEFDADTAVFNNLVETLGEWRKSWETTVKDSWHKQWLPVA